VEDAWSLRMIKARSVWEVSVWAGASLGGGPCPEKSVSLHWVVGNKESMSAGLRAWRKTAPWCKGREELLSQTMSDKR